MTSELDLLVQRLKNGDRSALAALYEKMSARLYGVAFHITKSKDLAEKTIRSVFVEIWENRGLRHPMPGQSFVDGLSALTRRRALALSRSSSHDGAVNQTRLTNDPLIKSRIRERQHNNRVSADDWQLVASMHIDRMSLDALAAHHNEPRDLLQARVQSAVRSVLGRASS